MTHLPIRHMTLYKHGVGFFQRRAQLSGGEAKISFRVEDMNDVLKSLTAIDLGGGQVLGVGYPTPRTTEERLASSSIRLGDRRSLRDLIISLRGRRVRLDLGENEGISGTLVGIDEMSDRHPLDGDPISLLLEGADTVQTVTLGQIRGLEIRDEGAAGDLRFFLETARGQDDHREVTIRLSEGDHDLTVAYIAPAPTWRVSYRLVLDREGSDNPEALLLGWGIFDNRLEEDLKSISLSLVAGRPISFIYDLYTPTTPERPVIEEEISPGPEIYAESAPVDRVAPMRLQAPAPAMMAKAAAAPMDLDDMAQAIETAAAGEDMGELFQYAITTPVSVERGHSAMVPIVSTRQGFRKVLVYNPDRMPRHPTATLQIQNETGLTLERGPVTVMRTEDYLGEAILPFTRSGARFEVPYAVELGVHVDEDGGLRQESHRLSVKGAYLQFEEWSIRWREYTLENRTNEAVTVVVEHPRSSRYHLFDSQAPVEETPAHLKFEVEAAAQGISVLAVQERRLVFRREELKRQSYKNLREYLQQGLIDPKAHDRAAEILALWEQIDDREGELKEAGREREKIYAAQKQIRDNMRALGRSPKEETMRSRYLDDLEASESALKALVGREEALRNEIADHRAEIERLIGTLGS